MPRARKPPLAFGIKKARMKLIWEGSLPRVRMAWNADRLVCCVVPHGPVFYVKSIEGLGGCFGEISHRPSKVLGCRWWGVVGQAGIDLLAAWTVYWLPQLLEAAGFVLQNGCREARPLAAVIFPLNNAGPPRSWDF